MSLCDSLSIPKRKFRQRLTRYRFSMLLLLVIISANDYLKMSCSLKIRKRSNGGDILENLKCDFCEQGIQTRHVGRFESSKGKFAIEARNGEDLVPICGLAFCVLCDENSMETEQRNLCPSHRQKPQKSSSLPLDQNRNELIKSKANPRKASCKTPHKSAKNPMMTPTCKATKPSFARNTVSYKDKKILAPSTMYLHENHCDKYASNPDVKTALMVGTIKELGNKKGHKYFIVWDDNTRPKSVMSGHLQHYFCHSAD